MTRGRAKGLAVLGAALTALLAGAYIAGVLSGAALHVTLGSRAIGFYHGNRVDQHAPLLQDVYRSPAAAGIAPVVGSRRRNPDGHATLLPQVNDPRAAAL